MSMTLTHSNPHLGWEKFDIASLLSDEASMGQEGHTFRQMRLDMLLSLQLKDDFVLHKTDGSYPWFKITAHTGAKYIYTLVWRIGI